MTIVNTYFLTNIAVSYTDRISHLATCKALAKAVLKSTRKELSLSSKTHVAKLSTLDKLVTALVENQERKKLLKLVANNVFVTRPTLGVIHDTQIGHFLALSYHLSGAGNRWDVTSNTTAADLMEARLGPKKCQSCGAYKEGKFISIARTYKLSMEV